MKLGGKYDLEWSDEQKAYWILIDGIREDSTECEYEKQYGAQKQFTKDHLLSLDFEELTKSKEKSIYIFPYYIVDAPRYSMLCRNIVETHRLAEVAQIKVMTLAKWKIGKPQTYWDPIPCVKLVFAPENSEFVNMTTMEKNGGHMVDYADVLENYVINPEQYPTGNNRYKHTNENYLNNCLSIEEFSPQYFHLGCPMQYFVLDEKGYAMSAEENREYVKTHQTLWCLYMNCHYDIPFCHDYIVEQINEHHDEIIYGTPHNIQGDIIRYQRILGITALLDFSEEAQQEHFNSRFKDYPKYEEWKERFNDACRELRSFKIGAANERQSEESKYLSESTIFRRKFFLYNFYNLLGEILLHENQKTCDQCEKQKTCDWLYNIPIQELSCLHEVVHFLATNFNVSGDLIDILNKIKDMKKNLSNYAYCRANGIIAWVSEYLLRECMLPLEDQMTARYKDELEKKEKEKQHAEEAQKVAEAELRMQEAMNASLAHEINNKLENAYCGLKQLARVDITETAKIKIRKIMRFIRPISARTHLIRYAYSNEKFLSGEETTVSLTNIVRIALHEAMEDVMSNLASLPRGNYISSGCDITAAINDEEVYNDFSFTSTYFNFIFELPNNLKELNTNSDYVEALCLLLHEYLLNAVKNSSFLPRDKRDIRVKIEREDSKLKVTIQNTFNIEKKEETFFSNHGLSLTRRLLSKVGDVTFTPSENLYIVNFSIELPDNKENC